MSPCRIADCERKAVGQQLCRRHYARFCRYGDPEAGGVFRIRDVHERWLSLVEKTDGCWLWQGGLNNKGYGMICVKGRKRGAHCVGYERYVGPIPAGLELDHLCRTPACVRPSHLEPVTHAENQRRAGAALTACRRAGHPYDEENTYRTPQGERRCRKCARERDQIRSATRNQAAA